VTVTTEKGKTDSTTTVVIRREGRGRERDQRMRRRRDWVLGCRMASLSLSSFPGTVFLQHRIHERGFLCLGLSGNVSAAGPTQSNFSGLDEEIKSSSAYFRLSPGYTVYRSMRDWLYSIACEGFYSYSFGKSTRTDTQNGIIMTEQSSVFRCWNYGLDVPITLERRFKIGDMVFSAGLRASLLSLFSSYEKDEMADSNHPENSTRTIRQPIQLAFASPFNGFASIQLKYWF
jgi:hypothetical protein